MKKKYMKLIGSIVLAFCLVATGVVATISAQAEEETTVDTTGWKNVGWSTEAKEYTTDIATLYEDGTIPDGYLFAGWYNRTGEGEEVTTTEGDTSVTKIVYDAEDFTAVRTPKDGEQWYVKYVPEKMLSVKAQNSANIIDKNGDTSVTANNSIRFVTSLDSTDYSDVGFKVFIGGVDQKAEENKTNFVYKTIYEIGATDTSKITSSNASEVFENLASKFFKTYTITYIPESVFGEDITVIPYYTTYDGTTVYGTATVRSVDFCCGTAYVTDAGTTTTDLKVDNFDASGLEISAGTYNSPATLPEAVANKFNSDLVDVTVYIKENITLKGQATVKNTMTITSLDASNPVTITGDPTASYSQSALIRVEAVGVTISDVIMDGTNLGVDSPARAISVGTGSPEATPLLIQDTTIQNFQYKGSDSGAGGAMWTRGYVVLSNSTLKDCSSTGNGGHIYIHTESVELKDNSLVSGGTCAEGKNGGNICVNSSSASLVLTDGTIEAGQTVGVSASTGNGGNIYSNGIVTMTGGTIQNGISKTKDGLHEDVQQYNDDGSEKTDNEGNLVVKDEDRGDNAGCGGNVYLTTSGKLNMTGGTISGGKAVKADDYDTTANSMSAVFGGGNIFAFRKATVSISGTAIVKDGTTDYRGGNIYMSANSTANAGTLNIKNATAAEGTISGGTARNGAGIFANRCNTTIENVTLLSGGEAENTGGFLHLWAGSASMKNVNISGGEATSGGIAYVSGNESNRSELTISEGATITSGKATNGGCVCISYGEFIMNKGAVVSEGDATGKGGNIYIDNTNTSKLTMYAGEISGGDAINETSTTTLDASGGNVYCAGTFTMYGGSVSGGEATGSQAANGYGIGGNILLYSVAKGDNKGWLRAYGGTISGGTASGRGGNIDVYGNSDCYLEKVTVIGGEAVNGGSIFVNATSGLTLIDTVVSNGKALSGEAGNIKFGGNGNLTITGGSVYGGTAKQRGGNIYISSTGTENIITDCAIYNGKTTNGHGGNIYSEGNVSYILAGNTKVYGGTASDKSGGNISFAGSKTLTIQDNVEIYNGTSSKGSNIYIWDPATVKLSGNVKIYNGEIRFDYAKNNSEATSASNGYGKIILDSTFVVPSDDEETTDVNEGIISVNADGVSNTGFVETTFITGVTTATSECFSSALSGYGLAFDEGTGSLKFVADAE